MYDMQAEARNLRASRNPRPATPAPVAKPVVTAKPAAPVLDKAKALARLAKVDAGAKALIVPNIGARQAIDEVRDLLVDTADFSAAVEKGRLWEADRIDRMLKARGTMPIEKRIAAIDSRLARAEAFVAAATEAEREERNERERKERLIKSRSGPNGKRY